MVMNFTNSSKHPRLYQIGRCPACGSEANPAGALRLPLYSVFTCHCGIKYIDPSLDEQGQIAIYQDSDSLTAINAALEQYYDYETLDPKSRTTKDYTAALAAVAALVTGRDLCEIGCGAGGFLAHAKAHGWNVLGIDSSSDNVSKTRSKGVEALPTNIFEFSTERFFNVVVLWDVLEHPQAPGKLLDRCRELLKPGGVLLIAIPYDPNIISSLARFFYGASFGKIQGPALKWYVVEHTSYFSRKGLTGLLARSGFSLLRSWKTETDLARYRFEASTRLILAALFFLARIFGLKNRMIAIARRT